MNAKRIDLCVLGKFQIIIKHFLFHIFNPRFSILLIWFLIFILYLFSSIWPLAPRSLERGNWTIVNDTYISVVLTQFCCPLYLHSLALSPLHELEKNEFKGTSDWRESVVKTKFTFSKPKIPKSIFKPNIAKNIFSQIPFQNQYIKMNEWYKVD